jgi:hypothetical protein
VSLGKSCCLSSSFSTVITQPNPAVQCSAPCLPDCAKCVCYKCFRWMLQNRLRCCICFNGCTLMLQRLLPIFHLYFLDVCCKYLDVAYVSHICHTCFIWMLRMLAMIFKCFQEPFLSISERYFKCFIYLFSYIAYLDSLKID